MKLVQKSRVYLAILLAVIVPIIGCASSQNIVTTAYKIDATTVTVVDTAMKGYGDLYKQGQISPDTEAKVKKAYEIYQSAMLAQISAVQAYDAVSKLTTASPAEVQAAQSNAQAALATASARVVDLFLMLSQAGVNKSLLSPVLK